jgi:hypothetical protein
MKSKPRKFVLASQDQCLKYRGEILKLLKALGHPAALVTDESIIGDFLMMGASAPAAEEFLEEVSRELGVEVGARDRLIDLAKDMRDCQR